MNPEVTEGLPAQNVTFFENPFFLLYIFGLKSNLFKTLRKANVMKCDLKVVKVYIRSHLYNGELVGSYGIKLSVFLV